MSPQQPSTGAKGWRALRAGLERTRQFKVLPTRVEQEIQRQQASSERLIAWIQLLVVATFALLYAIAPTTFPDEVEFAPVPWVLLVYLLFTLLQLHVSRRGIPPNWMIYLSICGNVALLYLLIWSFHLQYMQPPAFYLKAPTLLYIFIFLVLRALRFEVRFVLFAGACAAVGWLLMVYYVYQSSTSIHGVTRDYVEYMTSNALLLGAELDKIITILIVTLVLAMAIHRAKQLLVASVLEATIADDLSHFVPQTVADSLAEAPEQPHSGAARLTEAAIMFIDIAGFTSLSERLKPDAVVATLNGFFSLVEREVEAYNGVINQFQGDAVLISFETCHRSHTPSECAVQSALSIQHSLGQTRFADNTRLRCRIGINSGYVVNGFMGSSHRLIYTVHGDTVNIAARLEQLNKEMGTSILVSEAVYRECRAELAQFEARGAIQLRGRNSPVQVYSIAPSQRSAQDVTDAG